MDPPSVEILRAFAQRLITFSRDSCAVLVHPIQVLLSGFLSTLVLTFAVAFGSQFVRSTSAAGFHSLVIALAGRTKKQTQFLVKMGLQGKLYILVDNQAIDKLGSAMAIGIEFFER